MTRFLLHAEHFASGTCVPIKNRRHAGTVSKSWGVAPALLVEWSAGACRREPAYGSAEAAPAVRVVVVQVARVRGAPVDPPALAADVDRPVAARTAEVEPAPPVVDVVVHDLDQDRVRRRAALVVARRLHGDAAEVGGRLRRGLETQDAEAGHDRRYEGEFDASHRFPFIDEPSHYYAGATPDVNPILYNVPKAKLRLCTTTP